MIARRAFIGTLTVFLLAAPRGAGAQPAGKVARIAYLLLGSLESPETRASLDAFRQGLRERGYVEGQNIVIEYRAADGKIERLPALAIELARLKVDLIIVAGATPGAPTPRSESPVHLRLEAGEQVYVKRPNGSEVHGAVVNRSYALARITTARRP